MDKKHGVSKSHVVVVGAGLAGLTAAARLTREPGIRVTVLEGSQRIGGRAGTRDQDGFKLNFGPHALYAGGPADRTLSDLGVPWTGSKAPVAGRMLMEGRLRTLPSSAWSLLSTDALSGRARWQVARLFVTLPTLKLDGLRSVTVAAWLTQFEPAAAAVIECFFRLSTYAHAPDQFSVGVALAQLRAGLHGVYYLDGGWQTLADGLAAGLKNPVQTRSAVNQVASVGDEFRLRCRGGQTFRADAVILAVPPSVARSVVGDLADGWIGDPTPIRAAVLDVGLANWPSKAPRLVLGVDGPLYASLHSGVASLAPDGGDLMQLARYLAPGDPPDGPYREEMTDLLRAMWPGYEKLVTSERYLPSMTVTHDMADASTGALEGRTAVVCPTRPGLALAGDWVGPVGWLLDAAVASAEVAAGSVSDWLAMSLAEQRRAC